MTATWITALALAAGGGPPPAERPAPPKDGTAAYLAAKERGAVLGTVRGWQSLPVGERVDLAERLAGRLGEVTRSPIADPADLVIPYRLGTGDLKFQGHGHAVAQDLFIVGGRAAYAIGELIGVDLPDLNEGLSAEERGRRVAAIRLAVAAYKAGTRQAATPGARQAR